MDKTHTICNPKNGRLREVKIKESEDCNFHDPIDSAEKMMLDIITRLRSLHIDPFQ